MKKLPMKLTAWTQGGMMVLFCLQAGAFGVTNGDFETGDFSGWTVNVDTGYASGMQVPAGTIATVSSDTINFSGGNPPYSVRVGNFASSAPVDGLWFASVGTANTSMSSNLTYNVSLRQDIPINQGDTLFGWAFFFNGDSEAQDSLWVRIFDGDGDEVAAPWAITSGSASTGTTPGIPYRAASDWTFWQWEAPITGTYTLALGATTFGDASYDSIGFFDGIGVTPIPEPSSAALLLFCASVGMIVRRRRP